MSDPNVSTEQRAEIERQWAQGLSVLAMAELAGCSKNTISGRIHRLRQAGANLPFRDTRPSAGSPRKTPARSQRPAPASLLPPLAVLSPPAVLLKSTAAPAASPESTAPAPRTQPRPPGPARATVRRHTDTTCSFILSLRQEGELRFCDKPSEGHPTYCPEHRKLCIASASAGRSLKDPLLIPRAPSGPYRGFGDYR